ncbi:ribonuclease HI family protein [Patescibacteria group bacterium]|nr:ribonuclease HI family protein [Patescibacteria group bacterium]
MEKVIIYTDGGARGNPGPSAIGVYITDASGVVIREHKQTIGNATNNYAEYQAVIVALDILRQLYGEATATMEFELRLDSELVKKQITGEYRVKEPSLMALFLAVHNERVDNFPHLTLTHVRRALNKEADRLVNEALDGK